MKKWAIIAVLALLIAGGVFALRLRSDAAAASANTGPVYNPATVTRGVIREEVSCSGYVESNRDIEIKCKASGTIVELPYDISDRVEQGALLLKLDPVDEDRNVKQAEVQLETAEAKLAQARQSLAVAEMEIVNSRQEAQAALVAAQASEKDLREKAKRTAALLEKEYASPEEVVSAEASAVKAESETRRARVGLDKIATEQARLELTRQDIRLAEAEVQKYSIALDEARQRLSETQVYAPISGVISDRLVQIGQIIASPTMNVSGGTALLTLSDLSQIFVSASVDESDIGTVKPGQDAVVMVDAFPNECLHGRVVQVATQGENISNVVTFAVKIEVLDEAKSKLLPEMTADVEILVAENKDALLVPAEAVRGRGTEKTVLTPAPTPGAPPVPVVIELGLTNDTHVEVTSGLEEGDAILVAPDTGGTAWQREEGGGPPPMMGIGRALGGRR